MDTVVGKLGGIMRFPIESLLGETLDEWVQRLSAC
jgi:hypothetical protein